MRLGRNIGVFAGALIALVPALAGEYGNGNVFGVERDLFAKIAVTAVWSALSALVAGTFAKLVVWAISERRGRILWIGSLGILFVAFTAAATMEFRFRPDDVQRTQPMTFAGAAFIVNLGIVVALLLADLLMFVAFHFDRRCR
jgi:hypothetical protein